METSRGQHRVMVESLDNCRAIGTDIPVLSEDDKSEDGHRSRKRSASQAIAESCSK
jgi:hypothetical protein